MRKIIVNKAILTGFQILVAIISSGYLFLKFWQSRYLLGQMPQVNFVFLSLAILLMPLNYFLEASKWRLLQRRTRLIDLWTAYYEVLRGIPYGVITPWKIGEWYGRAEMSHNRFMTIVMAALGGYLQQLATVGFGLIGILGILGVRWNIAGLFVFWVILVVISYLFLGYAGTKWSKFAFLKEIFVVDYLLGFSLALLRYLVFSTQYVLVFLAFGVQADISFLYMSVFVIFFALNILPLNVIADLGIRGSVAVWLLANYADVYTVSLASLTLWGINVGLTTILGSLLLVKGVLVDKKV